MPEQAHPFGGRSRDEYEAMLLAKLQPDAIRATLSFAGLYQMTHEMLKQAILERVRDFYRTRFDETGSVLDQAAYNEHVVEAALSSGWINRRNQDFAAAAAWLVDMDAITAAQAKRLDAIYSHRHELTHELASFIIDPDRNLDPQIFIDAVEILRDVHRFWIGVEHDIGVFEHLGDISLDEISPASLMLLENCIGAYLGGLPNANE
ncbi:hypothetical protein [Paenarthrobacter sp. TA1.8]|uniref:hypothetical protein n=1 Tax=Paenarthrobacter sp. TA1.8 TaxID=3400219 RepID=UPI003B43B282